MDTTIALMALLLSSLAENNQCVLAGMFGQPTAEMRFGHSAISCSHIECTRRVRDKHDTEECRRAASPTWPPVIQVNKYRICHGIGIHAVS